MAAQVRSVLSKLFNVGSDDYDDDYDYDDEYDNYDDDYEEEPKKSFFKKRKDEDYDDYEDEEEPRRFIKKSSGKIKSMRQVREDGRMEIIVLKPTNFDVDSRKITEHLKYNRTVMIDLEGITIDLAQRIVDYSSGSSMAIDGDFSIVSKNFVIVSPPSVHVTGDVVESDDGSGAVNIME